MISEQLQFQILKVLSKEINNKIILVNKIESIVLDVFYLCRKQCICIRAAKIVVKAVNIIN